jgi:hypothetical protein
MTRVDPNNIRHLREMARRGATAATMFRELKGRLGSGAHILDILDCFRDAFCLTLSEAKPVGALSRSANRDITDEELLNTLVMPHIERHRRDWDK